MRELVECSKCMYFAPLRVREVGNGREAGSCRRHAPQVHFIGTAAMKIWPPVISTDSCGDFMGQPTPMEPTA